MEKNVPLAPLTTLRAGGPARYFFVVGTIEELAEAVAFAQKNNLPIFVLGGGSNVLISDEGFEGVVIKNEICGVKYEDMDANTTRVIAGAGEEWDALVAGTVSRGLYGLENLSLIPGTVGAAPIQNINAYGAHLEHAVEHVEVFDTRTHKTYTLKQSECAFAYRHSLFKENKHLIVTHVSFLLTRIGNVHYEYKDLQKYFARKNIDNPTLADVRDAVVSVRTGKLPRVEQVGTAGSFFMHPIVSKEKAEALKRHVPEVSLIPEPSGHIKVISGHLLDVLGWKNVQKGNVGTHRTHALTLVNHGEGNAQEVYVFARDMQKHVKKHTGIDLEFEVQLIGNF